MLRVTIAVVCICLFLTVCAEGQQASEERDVYRALAFRAEKTAVWEQFNQQYQNKWKVKWNSITGTPHRISGHHIEIPTTLTKENIESVSLKQLDDHKALLQIDPEALVLSKADFSAPKRPEAGAGTWRIYYRQTYHGIPVYGGSVRLVIRNQKLTALGSDYYPGIKISTEPEIPRAKAIEIASKYIDKEQPLKPISSELLIFPKPIPKAVRYHLAWQVTMPVIHVTGYPVDKDAILTPEKEPKPQKIPVQWRYFVDARTGSIIERINLIETEDFSGTVTGMIHPYIPADTPVEVPIAHMTVTLTQGGTDYTAVTDVDGNYLFTGLLAGPATLEAYLKGPHVEVHNNETADPDATHSTAVTLPGAHNWNWSADDPSPEDVETNAFYHVNWIRDWFLRGDPFNISPEPYPMQVYVRIGEGCNAFAGPSGLSFYGGVTSGCGDFALCSDIIFHEYTHRIVHKVYDDAAVLLPYSGQTGAMNEGWSDYFGSSTTGDPGHGEGCYGGRNIDTPDKRYPDDWVGGVHSDGMIFSGAIWDTRTALGTEYTDSLAIRAMKDARTSFNGYLEAILEEDDDPVYSPDPSANNNPSDGTPNIDTICNAFYDLHGIYCSYCVGYTEGPIAVITSPSPEEFNLFRAWDSSVTIIGTAAGSMADPLDNFVLEYGSGGAPTAWSSAGMTLSGGGTSAVVDGTLGSWDITGIADGPYTIRLTVTDAGARTAQFSTFVNIDRLLMAGWPKEEGKHFYSSPAVADVDPLYPGLEVVAASGGYLYVVHWDGTDAPGWPQPSGGWYCTSSPAVGDLDNDGSLEIVFADAYYIRVYNADGSIDPAFDKDLYPTQPRGTPAIADIDSDGDLEVVIGASDNNVYAWHHDGTSVAGWSISTGDEVESSPALGDLDNDGQMEVVIGSNDGNVYAWHADGSVVAGFPQATTNEVSCSPVLGDIDGDLDLEIVVGSRDSKVYAWHHNGTSVAGWPKDLTQFVISPASPALADIDMDGALEIVVVSNDDRIHAWEGDGTLVAGWPVDEPAFLGYEFVVSSPVAGDIDGDGDIEIIMEGTGIIMEGSGIPSPVYAFHHDGTSVAGWPKLVSWYSNSSPAIADIDQDGDAEVIIGSHGIYVWDLPGAYARRTMQWPFYRHNIRRTGAYGTRAELVLLFDTSGSMSWRHDGTMSVPVAEQRLTLAREAAYPFMELLNDFNSGKANFGIAVFPEHPWIWPMDCDGQIVTPMTLVTTASKNTAVTTTIPGLVAEGDTPLLAGMNTATSMLGVEVNQSIVLLSDGYHNCPSYVSVGDPEVVALIEKLNTNSIRVFTIGFGRPTDVDHPLLEAFADQTTPPGFVDSQFYDVTVPGFIPAAWVPATALQSFYKAILVDALDLQTGIDPLGVIEAGQKVTHEVSINEHDRRVSFFLSWVTPHEDRLNLVVKSSDDQEVPPVHTAADVYFHEGKTYKIITVSSSFLRQPGKVGPTPWKMEIDANQLDSGERENYQYSVIMDSALRMEAGFDKASYETGDNITVTARITEAGQPMTGLAEVYVDVTRPDEGIGNWFAVNRVSAEELKQIPEKRGDEKLSSVLRKAVFLSDIRKIDSPGSVKPVALRLYDDGTHGDANADDGIYTNQYVKTVKEGTYSFYFHATGPTSGGNAFDRDKVAQKYITVNVAPEYVLVDVVHLPSTKEKLEQFKIILTPRDALGNYLGPRYSGTIELAASQGKFANVLQDDLDGTYSQILELPSTVDARDVDITVGVKGVELEFNLAEKLKKPHRYSVSLNAGATIPTGEIDNDYDPGYSIRLGLDYHFTPQFAVLGLLGHSYFSSGTSSVSGTYWQSISVDMKYGFPLNHVQPYIIGGFGIYIPEDGSTRPGLNFGLGSDYSLNSSWTIEAGIDYHHVFTSNSDTRFFVPHIGLIYRF